jgi:predicted DNA-binding protein (UPF0251 family)
MLINGGIDGIRIQAHFIASHQVAIPGLNAERRATTQVHRCAKGKAQKKLSCSHETLQIAVTALRSKLLAALCNAKF